MQNSMWLFSHDLFEVDWLWLYTGVFTRCSVGVLKMFNWCGLLVWNVVCTQMRWSAVVWAVTTDSPTGIPWPNLTLCHHHCGNKHGFLYLTQIWQTFNQRVLQQCNNVIEDTDINLGQTWNNNIAVLSLLVMIDCWWLILWWPPPPWHGFLSQPLVRECDPICPQGWEQLCKYRAGTWHTRCDPQPRPGEAQSGHRSLQLSCQHPGGGVSAELQCLQPQKQTTVSQCWDPGSETNIDICIKSCSKRQKIILIWYKGF